jgi:hypothetical protein
LSSTTATAAHTRSATAAHLSSTTAAPATKA